MNHELLTLAGAPNLFEIAALLGAALWLRTVSRLLG